MSDSSADKQPKSQSSPSGGPPGPPKKTTRGLEDGAPDGKPFFGAEHIDLTNVQFTPELLRCLPTDMARKHRVLPVRKNETQIGIATADPSDLNAIDDLVDFFHRPVEMLVADKLQLDDFIERLYGDTGAR
jgi:hypothetical protein